MEGYLAGNNGHLMKALRYADYGGPLSLDDVPEPTCGPGQLRVRTLASSVNPIDWKLHSGALRFLRPIPRPAIPGLDVVGEVLESQAPGFNEGDRLVARVADVPGGVMAEQCLVTPEVAVPLPDTVSVEHAAALPLAGMTALQGLRDDCGMRIEGEDRRVLVVGASGGVGHYAVQLAHLAGAHVTAVCSGKRAGLVTELGADEVIDYRERDDFGDEPFDIIIDCAARAPWSLFRGVLAADGQLSQPTPSGSWIWPILTSKRVHFTRLVPTASDLQILVDRLASGSMRSIVGASFAWTDLADAWALNQKGGTEGKIVLTW